MATKELFAMTIAAASTLSILTVVALFNGALLSLLALYLYGHRGARPIVR
jgi:hypothetical protein